jgi:flagellar hook-associated protein 3 FlgL
MAIQTRVTTNSITTQVLANLHRNMARGGQLQEQLSSGKTINRPSDSPTGTVSSMQLRGDQRTMEQYSRNADDGIAWLSTLDTTLTGALTQVNRVRDLTLQGLSSGTTSAESREALAVEIDSIREGLIATANTKYLDRPVFGGTTAGGLAYDGAGTYVGDSGQVTRTVGNDVKVRVDTSGEEAFGTGANQLFTVLQGISDGLRANDTDAVGTGMAKLDVAGDTIKMKLADVGARYNRVSQMQQTAVDRILTLKTQRSDIEDVDLPQAIMEMQLQETAYQAALAATAKVIQPSLMDFLR